MTSLQVHDGEYAGALALVGMSGRFPGAQNVEAFWQNIAAGVKSIKFFSDEELLATGVDPAQLAQPNFVKAGSLLEHIDQFDAAFFGYTPREAELMDPQHRLFLECAWEALEGAGYNTESDHGLIGIYAGSSFCSYLVNNLYADPTFLESVGVVQASVGNERDALTSTISYKLNLKGPSVVVQTFCSTSLVAVHMACQSLLNYECDMAMAGGVAISVPHVGGYLYEEGGIVSPDGECRTFDAKAQGSVMGHGVGIVLLKRLDDALQSGDHIYAVIRGSAVNNDGSHRVSITAPGLDGQTEVIAEAIGNAGIDIESINYIEAHGTATEMGDAVELAAMTKTFEDQTQKKQFCAIGSVKPNVGHLDRAAGVSGLIKTALALTHKQLPPSLNFEQANEDINLQNSPFYVNTKLRDWPRQHTPRRAGVSSFGLGGTNAHVVLEEAPEREPSSPSRPWQLLLLSAKTETALQQATTNLLSHLQKHPELPLADVAYTLQTGRNTFNHRRTLVCRDHTEALALLQSATSHKSVQTAHEAFRDRPVAFLFPGLGEQYVGVTQELYHQEATFRETIDRCCDYLKRVHGISLKEVLFPPDMVSEQSNGRPAASAAPDLRALVGRHKRTSHANSELLKQTALAQPAVFVIEYALSQLLISWGIRPQAMLGYSVGEYVAACIAGVLSFEDALLLVSKRAQLIQEQPAGVMLAVALSEQRIQPFLSDQISLATINAPNTCVLAGSHQAIQSLQKRLDQQDIVYRQVETTHAFHSHMLNPLRESVTNLVRSITLHKPQISYISNVTGTWITDAQATDPTYWAQHMCQTVRFADGIEQLLQKPELLLLEVGPGQSLCSFVKQHPDCKRERASLVLPTLPSSYERDSEQAFLINTIGKLWLAGVTLDWSGFYTHEQRLRTPLPTYPFERQSYWVDPPKQQKNLASVPEKSSEFSSPLDELPRTPDLTNWFSVPTWKQALPLTSINQTHPLALSQSWVLFMDDAGLGIRLKHQLINSGQQVITVKSGTGFTRLPEHTYTIHPTQRADYDALFNELVEKNITPARIVHLWSVTPPNEQVELDSTLQNSFYSLITLAQALGELDLEQCEISIISNEAQEVLGDDLIQPEKATVIGPSRVIPQEYTNLSCRSIDVTLPISGSHQEEALIRQLIEELSLGEANEVIALRGNRRWVQHFEPAPLQKPESTRLRQQGVYLITGGLGGIALAMANYLAQQVTAKLVLTGRKALPPREQWSDILTTQGETEGVGRTLSQILQLEALGSEVLVIQADVSNEAHMRSAIEQTLATFGTLHGVLHAAGVPGIGLIQRKTAEQTAQVIGSKIQGTRILERVLRNQTLDFLVLFSSMTSVTGGGPGQVDYCAANAYLDAYARRFAHTHGRTIAIDWGEWQWNAWLDGLAGYNIEAQEYFRAHRNKFGISFAEGTDAFTRILSANLPHVVVSTQDFQIVAEQSKSFTAAAVLQHTQQSRQNRETHPRPNLASAYAAPNTDLERQIATIWEELLGITPVGIDDNFFELGGNSLLGMDLIARLKKKLGSKTLASHVIYEAPTVSTLAHYIEKGKTEMSTEEWQGRSEKRRAGLKQRIREASRVTR